MSEHLTSYEKQMKWRKASEKRAEKIRESQQTEQQQNQKFEPTFYSHPLKDFEGHARDLNDKSSQRFVERYQRARHEKPNQNISGSRSIMIDDRNTHTTEGSWHPNLQEDSVDYHQHHHHGHHEAESYPHHHEQRNSSQFGDLEVSSTSSSDEPIIELLERERKQWQAERERLIQCIHLQQLELTQRSMAAQERALEIAKDFARLIEVFEERLVNVESNVQKEISSLKAITESLVAASGKDIRTFPKTE